MRLVVLFMLMTLLLPGGARAGEVNIVDAEARVSSDGRYSFAVTLRHADNGWDHYADRWDVLGPDGGVLGSRVLMHPHVAEQPFTRSLSGIEIPGQLKAVFIRAHDKQHGDTKKQFKVLLPGR
jgi:hypothetical protein